MRLVPIVIAAFAGVCVAGLGSAMAQSEESKGGQPTIFDPIIWTATQPVYLAGSPVVIRCDYENRKLLLESVVLPGIPTASMPTLIGPDKAEMPTRLERGREPPFPRRGNRTAEEMRVNGRVSYYYDINLLFRIERPGIYTLKPNRSLRLPEIKLAVVDFVEPQRFDVSGWCDNTQTTEIRDVLPVYYELVAGRATPDGAENYWFVAVKNVKVRWEIGDAKLDLSRGGQMALRVEPKTEVKQQVLDHRWQLWTLLSAGEKNALFVWQLDAGKIDTVIAWTNEPIEMSAGPEFMMEQKVVVAGIAGKNRFTTSSLGQTEGKYETYGVFQPEVKMPGAVRRGR